MRQEMRISCFSSEADNLLMWSHYGDGLRGFCIAFDEEAITRGDTTGYVLDVAYLDAPPHVDSFIYGVAWDQDWYSHVRSEEHTSELQSLMRISYAVFCLKKKRTTTTHTNIITLTN